MTTETFVTIFTLSIAAGPRTVSFSVGSFVEDGLDFVGIDLVDVTEHFDDTGTHLFCDIEPVGGPAWF